MQALEYQPADPEEVANIIQDCKNDEGIRLDLPKKGLLAIPKEVRSLRKLKRLNLRNNAISMFPTELCEVLPDLEILNLSFNRLQYLPENLSGMVRLRMLLLSHNELRELPEGLTNLILLQELGIDHNALTRVPGSMGKIEQLKIFTLSNNGVSRLPASMLSLKHLEVLDLSENPLDYDNLPTSLHRLNEMFELLHRKDKRRMMVQRANAVRLGVRNSVQSAIMAGDDP